MTTTDAGFGSPATTRAEIARTCKDDPHSPRLAELYTRHKAERLAEQIRKAVSSAPALTDDQLARLASLFGPVGSSDV